MVDSRGSIFRQVGNELGVISFLTENEYLNDFPLHLVPSWEQACARLTKNTASGILKVDCGVVLRSNHFSNE